MLYLYDFLFISIIVLIKVKKKHLGDIDKNIDNIPKKDVFMRHFHKKKT